MKRLKLTVALLALALATSACTPQLPDFKAAQIDTAPNPALTASQTQSIVDAAVAELNQAASELNPGLLGNRVEGPAVTLRTAEITVAQMLGSSDQITELPASTSSVMMTSNVAWPRTIFTVSDRPQNLQSERMFVLQQASARAPYKLWGWIRLFPGITLPEFKSESVGNVELGADDATLKLSPRETLRAYADVLRFDNGSQYAAQFADEYMRSEVRTEQQGFYEKAVSINGAFDFTFTVNEENLFALQTSDGGALVVGQIDISQKLVGEEGSIINPDREKAWTKDTAATNSLTVNRTALLLIQVPAKDSVEQIKVLGREYLTTGASIP